MILAVGFGCVVAAEFQSSHAPTQDDPAALQQLLAEIRRHLDSGDFAAALPLAQQAVERSERLHDEPSLVVSLRTLQHALWGLGRYEEVLVTVNRALALSRKLGDTASEALCLNALGLTLYTTGRHDEALGHYELALEANRRAPTPRLDGTILANIGLIHRYEGRLDEAVRFFELSLRVRRDAGDKAGMGQSLNNLGMVSRARGEYQRAIEYYTESLALRREAGNRQGEAQTLHNLANVYSRLGQSERAIEGWTQALVIAREIGYTAQIGLSNDNIGSKLFDLGRYQEALPWVEAGLAIARQLNRPGDIASGLIRLGDLKLVHLRDLAGARAAYEEAAIVARRIKQRQIEAEAVGNLGTVALRAGDPQAALARFEESLAIAQAVGVPEEEYQARAGRGQAFRALGRTTEAIAELRSGALIVSDLRANIAGDLQKVSFLDMRQVVFHDLVETLWEAGDREAALESAEAARARALADLLGQREVLDQTSGRETLKQLHEAIDRARGTSPRDAAPGAASPSAAAARQGSRGPDAVDEILARLRSEREELASLVTVESPAAVEIRAIAKRLDATVVEYLVTEQQLFAWVIDPRGAINSTRVDVGRERLARLTTTLRERIERADLDALRHPERLARTLRELDGILIEPIARWLPAVPADLVVVVPHGPLALLPFAALMDARGKPLIERHTLGFAPAASVFRYTAAKRRPATPDSPARALVVADPTSPRNSGLAALPGTRQEAASVAVRLKPVAVVTLTGDRASESAVKRVAGAHTILHFATHGLVSADRPLESSLLLSEGEGDDGYLRVPEVLALDLHADLVVLSGCSTGLGRLSGDGILGLTRAFIYAGTPSIVVSQWDVSDRATVTLMDRFYRELQVGRGKAHALRAAQLATRARFSHPALWAAFVLVGEPR